MKVNRLAHICSAVKDCEFAFVHPKAANGVLELIDYQWPELTGHA